MRSNGIDLLCFISLCDFSSSGIFKQLFPRFFSLHFTVNLMTLLCLDFQTRHAQPWRAMLLKDSEGDLGICMANWIGYRKHQTKPAEG